MHVLITGATGGIGGALAKRYALAGAAVTVTGRQPAALQELVAELGGKAASVTVDLSAADAVARIVEGATAANGPVDILINNAGIQFTDLVQRISGEQAELQTLTNYLVPMRLIRAFLPSMLERKSGTIVNIASLAALSGLPGTTEYSATKAALGMASECLRRELMGQGVNVLTVYPGPVKTKMQQAAVDKFGDIGKRVPTGDVESLARIIECSVRKRKARIVYPRFYLTSYYMRVFSQAVTFWFGPKL